MTTNNILSREIEAAKRSLNQLIAVTAGARFARQTEQSKSDPVKRLDDCINLVFEEFKIATLENDLKAERQANRKLDSFKSLKVLALLVSDLSVNKSS